MAAIPKNQIFKLLKLTQKGTDLDFTKFILVVCKHRLSSVKITCNNFLARLIS